MVFFSYVVHAIQHEVTAIDHCVQGLVYRFDVCVRSKDIFPAPDAAVCIGVTVYGVHEVGLEVGQQSEVTGIQGAAFEGIVDADDCLVYVGHRPDGIVKRNFVFGQFVQTRSGRQCYGSQQDIISNFLYHFSFCLYCVRMKLQYPTCIGVKPGIVLCKYCLPLPGQVR